MSDASADQIKEIEDVIQKARQVKDPKSKEARELYQKAIMLADKYFKIDRPKEEIAEPTFDPDEKGTAGGHTQPTEVGGEAKAKTTLGEGAFVWDDKPSAIYLAAVKIHEYQHASNGVRLRKLTEAEVKQYKEAYPNSTAEDIAKIRVPEFKIGDVNEEEVISFDAMLKAKDKLGLTPGMIDWIKRERKKFLEKMPEENGRNIKSSLGSYPSAEAVLKKGDLRGETSHSRCQVCCDELDFNLSRDLHKPKSFRSPSDGSEAD